MINELIRIESSLLLGEKPSISVPEGGWVAGGAIRRWFKGQENLTDIDVFFSSVTHFQDYEKSLSIYCPKVGETVNAITYMSPQEVPIQLIRASYYDTMTNLLDSFDYSVCQFAWDGKDVYATSQALISVLRNHLGPHNIRQEHAVDSLRRAFKYAKKGYYPCNGTLLALANALVGLTQEQVKNATEISPGGGHRIMRFD